MTRWANFGGWADKGEQDQHNCNPSEKHQPTLERPRHEGNGFVCGALDASLPWVPMADSDSFRLGVLGSGRGSNLAAIADAISRGDIPAEITAVISDVQDAPFLQHAERLGIPSQFIDPGKYRTKLDDDAEQAYIAALQLARVDLVVLAGFMRILKGEFLRVFEGRVINIHPSLLPSFPGLEAWKQALDYGVKYTGATVHFVDQGIDSGAIIAQETLPVRDEDSPESLLERIHSAEHRILPGAIAAIARGEVELQGRRTVRRNP